MIQLDFSKPLHTLIELLNSHDEKWILDIADFIKEWNKDGNQISIQTSGTTGSPKYFQVDRAWMIYSAKNTIHYFGLKPTNTALLALSPHFIAGKMMLVRSIVGQLKLWICPPNNLSILNNTIAIDFCPLVPLQAEKYLPNLGKIKHLLLGGAPVSESLEVKLRALSCEVYQSFAMTETLSHFALKNISKEEKAYKVFPTIKFGVNDEQCLWIKAPELGQEFIQTTDVVELVEGGFIWKQRADFMINSGGIKYNPEVLEKQCDFLHLRGWQFIISSVSDTKLGSKLVLVVEEKSLNGRFNGLAKHEFNLDDYAIPKRIYIVKKIPKTPFSQKVTRLDQQLIFAKANIVAEHEIL